MNTRPLTCEFDHYCNGLYIHLITRTIHLPSITENGSHSFRAIFQFQWLAVGAPAQRRSTITARSTEITHCLAQCREYTTAGSQVQTGRSTCPATHSRTGQQITKNTAIFPYNDFSRPWKFCHIKNAVRHSFLIDIPPTEIIISKKHFDR